MCNKQGNVQQLKVRIDNQISGVKGLNGSLKLIIFAISMFQYRTIPCHIQPFGIVSNFNTHIYNNSN